ncbi:MAG TPA: hypothetical protein VFL64_06610 [Rhizobacter sp.]|nr:hypothetical protein [Rhizobacter sp.]
MSQVLVSRFVRNVLLADAGVSAAAGAVMVLGGAALQALLGLPGSLLLPAGLFLFGYAAALAWLSRRERLPRAVMWVLVLGNVVWAADCGLIAFGAGFAPTTWGQALLGVQIVAVLVFAELQFVCLRRAGRQPVLA